MKSKLMMTICLSSFSLVFIQLAQAQYCGVSNASLTGSYGFVASEAGASTTGTTTGTHDGPEPIPIATPISDSYWAASRQETSSLFLVF